MSYPISKDGRAQQHKQLGKLQASQDITALWGCVTAAIRVCKCIGCAAMPKGDNVLSAHQKNMNTPSVASMSVEKVHIGALKLAHGVLQQ